ncbi:hypothetical protein [Petralouisia muris]|uniref:hypothetical protein n=1 Tax=Petralouisia muris TaxID=3032872 RepID=UPI0023B8249E|nr:hypothetical protein [Petralouisia muris]
MTLGVQNNYYQREIVPTSTGSNRTEREEKTFAQKLSVTGASDVEQTKAMTPEEELEAFKKEFYQELSEITMHATVSNAAVNVSEAAFKRMKDDPEYKEQVLSWIKRDLGGSYGSRNASVMLTVGDTLEQCRGDAWPVSADSEFGIRSQDSFYKRSNERKERQKELLEEYLQKRQEAKRIQQDILDRKDETQRINKEYLKRQDAVSAYDNQIISQ